MKNRALIAMSGGVDSSVAAYLTKKSGYDCIGATMKLFANDDIELSKEHSCCSLDDVADAKAVAARLDMPHYVFNFRERFKEDVIDKFVTCYECGITPNPCIDCNRYLKFSELFRRATELECDYVVTGHYARTGYDEKTGRYRLLKAVDSSKDQSYVLYSLTQEQLAHVLFPLGNYPKTEARNIANQQGFINANKHDSQDICFVTSGSYADFIEGYTGKIYPEGDFVDTKGNILGTHKGIIRYTVGQRKGLGLSLKQPMYVKEVNTAENKLVLATNEELYDTSVTANNINLISVDRITEPMRVKAKVRYRHEEQWGTATQPDDDTLHVEFDEPQRAITKGQALVLYDGDTVIGGGTII